MLLLALAVLLVAVLAVVLKAGDQRADGIRVLEQLGQMLAKVLDMLVKVFDAFSGHRRSRRGHPDDEAGKNGEPSDQPHEEDASH